MSQLSTSRVRMQGQDKKNLEGNLHRKKSPRVHMFLEDMEWVLLTNSSMKILLDILDSFLMLILLESMSPLHT